jgi:6,7-dimethyl-8-ribityllumazine synthase
MSIAIVVSRFNQEITERLLQGAVERLKELEIEENELHVVWVPGAIELPLVAQQFAKQENCEAVICLGAVIRGETDHYDYVCQQVSYGCQRVALDYDVPVIFGVLTTENEEQARERTGGAHGHKGREAAEAAIEMMALMQPEGECACHACH